MSLATFVDYLLQWLKPHFLKACHKDFFGNECRKNQCLLHLYTAVYSKLMKNNNSNYAYDYIRKRILSGEYPPGHSLLTNPLASEIGVSRTPVRDALRQLEGEGLVSILPYHGASVKSMDLEELRDLCELRLALESHAAGLSARNRTPADLQEINHILKVMTDLAERIIASNKEEPLIRELEKEDVRFHIAIMNSARNELFKKEILRLHLINRIVSGRFPAIAGNASDEKKERDKRRRATMASHQAIYDAIERQDVAVAKSEMERHIQNIIDNRFQIIARSESNLISRDLTDEELYYIN